MLSLLGLLPVLDDDDDDDDGGREVRLEANFEGLGEAGGEYVAAGVGAEYVRVRLLLSFEGAGAGVDVLAVVVLLLYCLLRLEVRPEGRGAGFVTVNGAAGGVRVMTADGAVAA